MNSRGLCEHAYLLRNCPYCVITGLRREVSILKFQLAEEQSARQEAEAEIIHLEASVRQLRRRRREEAERTTPLERKKAA